MAGPTRSEASPPLLPSRQPPLAGVEVRCLRERDVDLAEAIFRRAFGTFLGLPDPMAFAGDTGFARTRFRADPEAAFGAYAGPELVGSNFVARWGSLGFFGPLTVRPDLWDRGIARLLITATTDLLDRSGIVHRGLYTFAQSPKHVALYQKHGFWPRSLTAILSKPPSAGGPALESIAAASADRKDKLLGACRDIAETLYPGLDLAREILSVDRQGLGDTLVLERAGTPRGFAVCHSGPGTEAGSGVCHVKFAAVRTGPDAPADFGTLVGGCEAFATRRGASLLKAGVNTARLRAYRALLASGFRSETQGVVMESDEGPGYNRPDVYAIDDWR